MVPMKTNCSTGMALVVAALFATGLSAEETRPAGATNDAPKKLTLVKASPTPLGENSVMAVSPGEAKRELEGLKSGKVQDRIVEPLPKSVAEQGGVARMLFKEPKAKKLLSLFNPLAPTDAQTEYLRTHRVYTIRGTPPVPRTMQDPIWMEPVGVSFVNFDY